MNIAITVTHSTNPATAHIGSYFADIRDITNGRNRQMTTRTGKATDLAEFITKFSQAAFARSTAHVSFHDETAGQAFSRESRMFE